LGYYRVAKEELAVQIKEFASDDIVMIVSDKASVYEDFVFVVDQLKLNKINKISMGVQE